MVRSILSLDEIQVNDENPRFEPVENEQEAIESIIFLNENQIFNLCRHINDNGLNPTEIISVVGTEEGGHVVLDGNRRIVAMKLLENPNLAGNNNRLIQKIKNLEPNLSFDEIPVIIFDNKDEAEIWIELKHTGVNEGVGTVAWSPLQRERFKGGAYHYALSLLDYLDKYTGKYTYMDAKNVDLSSLQRVLGDPDVRKCMGLKREGPFLHFSDSSADGNIDLLLDEMLNDTFTVDRIRRKNDRKEFIEKTLGVGKYATEVSSNALSKDDAIDNKVSTLAREATVNQQSSPISSRKNIKQAPRSTARKTLIPNDFVVDTSIDKINDLIREMKKISVHDFPIMVGIALRSLIEMMLDEFCLNFDEKYSPESTNFEQKVSSTKKILVKYLKESAPPKNMIREKDLKRIIKDTLEVTLLHGYVHSHHLQITPSELNMAI